MILRLSSLGAIQNCFVKKTEYSHVVQDGLKAQKLLAQGSALGMLAISIAPCKGKSFKKSSTYNIFPTSDTQNRILAPPHFTGPLELNTEYQFHNKLISLTNSVFIPLYMPHTPHERLESPGQQSKLHHRSSHRGDRRGSRFDSPKQKCHFRFLFYCLYQILYF